jgi:hypothetical protein
MPAVAVSQPQQAIHQPQPAVHQPQQGINQPPAVRQATGTTTLTPEKFAKLRSQLDVVQGNVQVMSEMLIAVTPGEETPEDRELLKVMF